jgi:hemerythrin-like metal-binding protein
MKNGQLQDRLYDLIPLFYVGVGLLTLSALRSGLAIVSGLALLSAGGLAWWVRSRFRGAFPSMAGRKVGDGDRPGEFAQISWQKSYETGYPRIDTQHRRLFILGNALINAVAAKLPHSDLEWLIDELIDYITRHFCAEESALTAINHPNFSEHQKLHRALLARAQQMHDRFHGSATISGEFLTFITRDIIVDHISKEAIEFRAAIESPPETKAITGS